VIIENPIWDKVLKATTFFTSSSTMALNLEKKVVKTPVKNKNFITLKFIKKKLKLKSKISPAVTKVLLWTRELTGVGALIALGNQPLKGNCALLVKAVRHKKKL